MDLVLSFLISKNLNTSGKFVASGSSKRGWTSLLITAVDSRVIGNLPIVYDLINMNEVCKIKIFNNNDMIQYSFSMNRLFDTIFSHFSETKIEFVFRDLKSLYQYVLMIKHHSAEYSAE